MTELHVVKSKGKRKTLKRITQEAALADQWEAPDGEQISSQHEIISMLLPPAVKAFYAELAAEVEALCGKRHSRGTPAQRWATQPGSIQLGNQKVAIEKPRVRDQESNREKTLYTYARFQDPSLFDENVFEQGLKRVSQRDYEKGLPKIAQSFGISKSTVSRRWIKVTEKQVEKLLHRDIGPLDIVAVFIDGKRFARLGVVVALGVGRDGKKYVLGIYQSSTENSAACLALLADLEKRGLPERELLFIVDGGSGLNKALNEKYQIDDPANRRAYRVRCYVHKWRNISDVLDEKGQAEAGPLFWAMRDARDYSSAKAASDALESCLKRHNVSALNSYHEAKDDLLAIHRLQVGRELRAILSTTNPIESLNSLLEEDLRRVKRWRDSQHFQRWMATACLRNEKRMRRVKGHRGLPALVIRLRELCNANSAIDNNVAVA
jgi:transposase-like protein